MVYRMDRTRVIAEGGKPFDAGFFAKPGQGIAGLVEPGTHGTASEQVDFERADRLGDIIRMDQPGGAWIEAAEQAMERARTALFASAQQGAEPFVPSGRGGKAVEQGAQVESGSADDYREVDALEQRARAVGEFSSGEDLVRVEDIEHVMRDPVALFDRELGGSDVEVAIN